MGWRREVTARARCEDGQFRIPDRPGHGVALAPGAERRYASA